MRCIYYLQSDAGGKLCCHPDNPSVECTNNEEECLLFEGIEQ